MHVIEARNVCEALPLGLKYLREHGAQEQSRNGPVIVAPGPVTTLYERPLERVLISPMRDANPFFHIAEAMWMLAGRDDAAFLNLFVRDLGARYADGDVLHGAYGHRWRRALGFDQLDRVVSTLRADPTSRQCVIQMWDAVLSNDAIGIWRDRPCNTHVYLRVADLGRGDDVGRGRVLNMQILCRSNDIVWGAHGANAVHFAFLQEYLAARIGVEVGRMWQTSWNYHAYVSEVSRLAGRVSGGTTSDLIGALAADQEFYDSVRPEPLASSPDTFDAECALLLRLFESIDWRAAAPAQVDRHMEVGRMKNAFLVHTVWPMLCAHGRHRAGDTAAGLGWMTMVRATDWRRAGIEWLERRAK